MMKSVRSPGFLLRIMSTPIEIPDRLNMAEWFLDARLEEGLGDKTAIYYEDTEVTYGQLVARSAQVAAVLRNLGVRIEERVMRMVSAALRKPTAIAGTA